MTLTVLTSTGQVFCRISLDWDMSNAFLMIWLGLGFWEEDKRGVQCHFLSHHIKDTYLQHVLPLLILTSMKVKLPEVMFIMFLYCYSTPFSSFPYYTLKASHYVQSTHKEWEIRSISLREENFHKLFGNVHGIVSSLPLMHSLNHWFVSV